MTQLHIDIGQCIYCGSTEPPLTREHVLPRGLGGNMAPEDFKDALVLQNATCEKCRQITQKIEDDCLRQMMNSGRARLGLKRKDRNDTRMSALINSPNNPAEFRDVDSDKILGVVVLPSYYEAGVLNDRPLDEVVGCDYQLTIIAPTHESLLQQHPSVGVSFTADGKTYAQMLAKIGLGVAVAKHGINGFKPLVQNFILRHREEFSHWVGGFAGMDIKPEKSKELHSVKLFNAQANTGAYVIAEIRLFAEFGGPTNYVVVGKPLK